MTESDPKTARNKPQFSPKSIERYTVEEARGLLWDLLTDSAMARVLVQATDYPPRALIQIAVKAGGDTKESRGTCLTADQMEEFASFQMQTRDAVLRASHLASGCTDCKSRFEIVSGELEASYQADRDASTEYQIAEFWLQQGEESLSEKRAAARKARTDFLLARARVLQQFANEPQRIRRKFI